MFSFLNIKGLLKFLKHARYKDAVNWKRKLETCGPVNPLFNPSLEMSAGMSNVLLIMARLVQPLYSKPDQEDDTPKSSLNP